MVLLFLCSVSYILFAQDNSDMSGKKMKMKSKKTEITANTNTSITSSAGSFQTNPPSLQTTPASLPVLQTDISSTTLTSLKSKYGDKLYDVTKLKAMSGQDIYLIRVIDNGQISSDYIDENGNTVLR